MASSLTLTMSEDPQVAKKAVAQALSSLGDDKEHATENEGYADSLVNLCNNSARITKLYTTVERKLSALDTENLSDSSGNVTAFGPQIRKIADVRVTLCSFCRCLRTSCP